MGTIDELVGYARANVDAAQTRDEQQTWAAHHRHALAAKAENERLRALLRRTAAVLAAAAAGSRCSISAGDLYRDIIAAKIISDEQSVKTEEQNR